MRSLMIIIYLLLVGITGFSQNLVDSLKHQLRMAKHDTDRVLLMTDIAFNDFVSNPQGSKLYAQKALDFSNRIKFSKGEAKA